VPRRRPARYGRDDLERAAWDLQARGQESALEYAQQVRAVLKLLNVDPDAAVVAAREWVGKWIDRDSDEEEAEGARVLLAEAVLEGLMLGLHIGGGTVDTGLNGRAPDALRPRH